MSFPIHNNVPTPTITRRGRPGIEFPFVALDVGQSFFVPLDGDERKTVLSRVRTKAQRWKKTSGLTHFKFRISPLNDPASGAPAVGVWRIA